MILACIQYLRENSYEENAKKMKKKIRGIFPCNMRVGEVDIHDSKQFGNHFTMVPIDFPLHYTDPMTMLRESKERCNVMKISPYAATVLSLNQLAMKVMSRRFYINFTRLMFDKFTYVLVVVHSKALYHVIMHHLHVHDGAFFLLMMTVRTDFYSRTCLVRKT